MLATGAAASTLYFCKYAYVEYAVSRADIVLTYPEISESRYPNGSRFTYYSFISNENVAKALEIMKKDGKYENFTVEDLNDKFYLYSYLENSAGDSVSSARSQGNDFSYVANEYKITFVQPHDYNNKDIVKKFFGTDYSGDFLEALVEVNRTNIAEALGGINGFEKLTQISNNENYDYSEEVKVYKTKINTIVSYLNYLDKKEPDFVSSNDMSLKDIKGKYEFLIANKLDGISNFIESSGISKDVGLASNKLKVNIENNALKYNKFFDRAKINKYAMENYDQTFTENLINVVQNEEYGLYQARPKTAFDTVVVQKHEADENTAEYGAKINQFNRELTIYGNVVQTPEEYERLTGKCDELVSQFKKEYSDISNVACKLVREYYNEINAEYITAKITKKGLFTDKLIVKMGFVFFMGMIISFVAAVFITAVNDNRKLRRKKKLIRSIKQTAEEEDVQ